MGHDWRAYDGCLEPKTNRNWMTEVRTQGQNECVAYGTLAALESMLKIHYYNDAGREDFNLFDAKIDNTDKNLLQEMGTDVSVSNACTILQRDGIIIPDRSTAYKIAGSSYINSEGMNSVETIIAKAKVYLETNGPIIAKYNDDVIGSHCLAIVGYTDAGNWICKDSWPLNNGVPYHNSSSTWNTDGTCKIHDANGGYREINADDMIRKRSGNLYAILLQRLAISIKHNSTPPTSITNWWKALLEIRKKIGVNNYVPLAELDPTHVSRFHEDNPDYELEYCYPRKKWYWGLRLSPPEGRSLNLDNLKADVGPGDYHMYVHACSNTNENWDGPATVGDSDTSVEILLNKVGQCAQEILYPFALDAMKRLEDEKSDLKVALRLLLRTAEISKEEFIADLEERLVDLDKAHGCGIDGALEIRRATEEIRKLVRSMED